MSLEIQAENLPYSKTGSLTLEELSALYKDGPLDSKDDNLEPLGDSYVPLSKSASLPFDDEAKHSTKSSDHDDGMSSHQNDHNGQDDHPSDQRENRQGEETSVENVARTRGLEVPGGNLYSSFGGQSWRETQAKEGDESPGIVVRNDHYCSQRATVSFGVDASRRDGGVLDVVNYYRPNGDKWEFADSRRSILSRGRMTDHLDEHTMLPSEGFSARRNEEFLTGENELLERGKIGETRLYGKNGRPRGHVGGDSTASSIIVNSRNAHSTHSGYTDASPYNLLSDSDAGKLQNGLFEVPFNVYSVPRLVDPFKGFSKIHTQRAVKFLHFSKVEDKLICKLDKNASKLLKKQIGNCKVVSTSIVGDPRSGKSYLAGLLVGKGSKSFKISDPFAVQTKCEGTIWVYVAIYEEKYAYLFLDFDGFEGSDADRIKMLSFALAASHCVLASFKASVMSGVFELVQSMINLSVAGDDESDRSDDGEENDIVEIFRKKTTRLFIREDDEGDVSDRMSSMEDGTNEIGENLWSPPIVHFIFRDSNDFIKCLDERNYTPETLVEQGIFEHYLDIFKCTSEHNMEFKNNMLDAFSIFTNRKYTCLPYPLRPRKKQDVGRTGVGQILLNFLAQNETKDAHVEDDDHQLVPTQNISLMPMTALSNHFFERLDEVKTCVYQDTLTHARANSQLSGRMFVRFVKLLAEHFNIGNALTIKDVNSILTRVHFDENESVKKDSIVYFLKIIKSKVAPLLPINSRELLSKSMQAKQKALQYFESKAFGSFKDYSRVYDVLGNTLDELTTKLDKKNTSIINYKITSFVERRAEVLNYRIAKREYTPQDLDAEILKTKRALQRKFNDAVIVDSALVQVSQKLVELFNYHHPDVYIARIHATSIDIEEEPYTNKFSSLPSRVTLDDPEDATSKNDDTPKNEPEETASGQDESPQNDHNVHDGSMGDDDIDAHVDETTPGTLTEDPTPQSQADDVKRMGSEKRVTIAERPITITRVY